MCIYINRRGHARWDWDSMAAAVFSVIAGDKEPLVLVGHAPAHPSKAPWFSTTMIVTFRLGFAHRNVCAPRLAPLAISVPGEPVSSTSTGASSGLVVLTTEALSAGTPSLLGAGVSVALVFSVAAGMVDSLPMVREVRAISDRTGRTCKFQCGGYCLETSRLIE